ncbi:MAG: hypothetical protein GX130_11555 [Candidatus Hydrogenedens sp.]|nr:hypothetical protein [Candidatus Hydrogenedens sp.]
MRSQELRLSYQEAIQLIRVGHYEAAHRLLKAIDNERPNVKNVLYPLAVCCEALGLVDEGLDYCDTLIKDYDHAKAKKIKERLFTSLPVPEAVELPARKEKAEPPSSEPAEVIDPEIATVPEETGDDEQKDSPPFSQIEEVENPLISDDDPEEKEKEPATDFREDSELEEMEPSDETETETETEAEKDTDTDTERETDTERDEKVKAPFWLILVLAFLAAAVSAGLIHYFILGTEQPLLFLKELYTKIVETLHSLHS